MLTSKEVAAIMKNDAAKLLHARIDELEGALINSSNIINVAAAMSKSESMTERLNKRLVLNNKILKKGISV